MAPVYLVSAGLDSFRDEIWLLAHRLRRSLQMEFVENAHNANKCHWLLWMDPDPTLIICLNLLYSCRSLEQIFLSEHIFILKFNLEYFISTFVLFVTFGLNCYYCIMMELLDWILRLPRFGSIGLVPKLSPT